MSFIRVFRVSNLIRKFEVYSIREGKVNFFVDGACRDRIVINNCKLLYLYRGFCCGFVYSLKDCLLFRRMFEEVFILF